MKLRLLFSLIIASLCIPSMLADKDNRASLKTLPAKVYGAKGQTVELSFQFTNTGNKAPTSFEVITTLDGATASQNVELDGSIKKGKTGIFKIALACPENGGNYPLTVNISKVNGVENDASTHERSTSLAVLEKYIKRVSLMEEYTGTWCGFCPRGWVALEALNRDMPEEVVCVAYHAGDPMQTEGASLTLPQSVDGYPSMYLNRDQSLSSSAPHNYVIEANMTPSSASVTVEAVWADENQTSIEANATIDFALDAEAGAYSVEYILRHDNMKNEAEWFQSNYYSGGGADSDDPLWSNFVGQDSYVAGLTFNDVAIANSRFYKFDGTLAAGTPAAPAQSSFMFEGVDKLKSSQDMKTILQNREDLKVIAVLTDNSSKKVIYAAECHVKPYGSAGVDAPSNDDADAPVEFFNLQGMKVNSDNLTPGIYVRKIGTKTSKIVVR